MNGIRDQMDKFPKFSGRGLVVILVLIVSVFSAHTVLAETNQAGLKLQAANDALNGAFGAVLNAERAGANVTGLLDRLNCAVDLLAQAEVAYRNGDLDLVIPKADLVVSQCSDVRSAAESAKSAALVSGKNAFMFSVGFSVVGCVFFVLGLFFVWRRFRAYYLANLDGEKPEVSGDAV